VLSTLIFAFVIATWGEPIISKQPIIGSVISGMPAQTAGLQSDDRLVSINGIPLSTWDQAAEIIRLHPEESMKLNIRRGTGDIHLMLTPQRDASRAGVGVVGITPKTEFISVPASQALTKGAQQSFYWSLFTLRYLKEKIVRGERPDISGPLGIAQVVAKAVHAGWQDFLFLIGMISVGVGLFNLFPIPMLDGGHMAFYLIEGALRKPLKPRTIQMANSVGFSLIMAILLFATFNDIQRLRASHETASAAQKAP
jgi:regulator of sigma E protease